MKSTTARRVITGRAVCTACGVAKDPRKEPGLFCNTCDRRAMDAAEARLRRTCPRCGRTYLAPCADAPPEWECFRCLLAATS